jgi:hypothetical protein
MGDAAHGVLQHLRPDRHALGRAGRAAGEDVYAGLAQNPVAFGTDESATVGEHFDAGSGRRDGDRRASDAMRRVDDGLRPVVAVGDHRRGPQRRDVRGDRPRRLVGVDHHHRSFRRDEPEDGRRVWDSIAHHHADGLVDVDACLVECSVEAFPIAVDVIAGVPGALELDERLRTVSGEAAGQVVCEGLGV